MANQKQSFLEKMLRHELRNQYASLEASLRLQENGGDPSLDIEGHEKELQTALNVIDCYVSNVDILGLTEEEFPAVEFNFDGDLGEKLEYCRERIKEVESLNKSTHSGLSSSYLELEEFLEPLTEFGGDELVLNSEAAMDKLVALDAGARPAVNTIGKNYVEHGRPSAAELGRKPELEIEVKENLTHYEIGINDNGVYEEGSGAKGEGLRIIDAVAELYGIKADYGLEDSADFGYALEVPKPSAAAFLENY
ncbi:hypothetical protein [Candidatus Nanohalococcus occultus]|uniref:Histidine kinase n=1 Tax=Candidatus Nanohalococcus occultus TaxID=2978047 RepID=A0ABY8CGM6_9ARCH|nr:hypothetical protein SVXNc_0153 [Candidatus Nanohaloarchaeota archaeon SVXNc]